MATVAQCARHLDMTERRFYELVEAGTISRAEGRGKYDVDFVRHQYIRHLRDTAAGRGTDTERASDEATSQSRKAAAEAEMAEMKRDQMRGSLVPADQVADAMAAVVSNVKTRMLGVPAKVAPIVGAKDTARAEQVIRGEITEGLTQLSEIKVVTSDD